MTDEKVIKKLQEILETMCNDGDLQTAATVGNALDLIRRKKVENNQLRVKLDDYERDIVPKLKYSLERANKYGAETEAENIRLLKENENLTSANEYLTSAYENLTSDLTSAKAEIERLGLSLESMLFEVKNAHELRDEAITNTIKAFAEQVKMAFYYEFDELIPSIMADKIDNLVKEMLGEQE